MRTSESHRTWEVVSLLVVAGFVLGHIMLAKVRPCLPEADCQAYIAMTSQWGFNEALLPHHAMRVLPSMLASMLMACGLSMAMAFQLLSAAAYGLFAFGFFKLLERLHPKNPINAWMTLLVVSAHWVMVMPLSQVYQANDAWTYPLGVLMVWLTYQNRPGALCVVGMLGIIVRQNLFVLAFLALAQLFWRHREKRVIAYGLLVTLVYVGLTEYYQAGGSLIKHLIPTQDFFTVRFWQHFLTDSDILYLFLPLTPFLLFYTRQMATFFEKNSYLFLYAGIVIGQPLVAYEMTGQANFVRIAMQGVWPFYLAAAWAVAEQKSSPYLYYALGAYCLLMATTWSEATRIAGVFLICIIFGGLWWQNRQRLASSPQS